MLLFSQTDNAWRNKELGWGPPGSTIGLYGCYETVGAMIANDALGGINPATLDDRLSAMQIFLRDPDGSGDYDLVPDNFLDRAYPGRFSTTSAGGWDQARVSAAIASPDTYVALFLSGWSPLWGINVVTHFVLAWNGTKIADPEGAAVRDLSGYGGVGNVHKMVFITKHPDPAIAAAAAAQAAATAKAAADAAAAHAKAVADAQAAAAVQAAAAAAAAQAAATQAAAEHAAELAGAALDAYLAEQAAKAKAVSVPLPVPTKLLSAKGCNIVGRQVAAIRP